jgi:hypothetical protein
MDGTGAKSGASPPFRLRATFEKTRALMADVHKYFAIRRVAVAATGPDGKPGTPIVVPIDCTQIVIENTDAANDMTVYTDPDDGTTTKTLPKSLELTLRATSSGDCVFLRGDTICRIAPSSGSGPVCVTFLR